MLPLRGQAAVAGLDGPLVGHRADVALAGVDHRLDREDHARLELDARARAPVVDDLRVLVEHRADAVTAVFAHDAVALRFRMLLDRVADVAEMRAGPHLVDAEPHAFVGGLHEALREDRALADDEHPARVAEIAVLDDGDVDVQRVAVLERLLARDAVADHVVDRRADRLRERRIAGRLVVERRGHRALHMGHVFVAEAIEFARRHAGDDEWRDVVEHFARETAGDAHLRDVVFVFERNSHESMPEMR
ncbi:Uncharacterised protein [Burkholderia pseudomallei]|nr:Uncharacterised protein [Burkholderia pseudomallei]